MSMKMNKKNVLTLAVILIFIITIAVLALNHTHFGLGSAAGVSVQDANSLSGKTNTNRIEFFKHYGWEISSEPSEITDVAIPREFDEVFEDYNKIQKSQGMDLCKYKGKVAKRYSYNINNYPKHPENIRGNILVYEGKIIACDICSLELEGFMHGIVNPI